MAREGTVEYSTWKDMRKRCTNPNTRCYKNYGARGVNVCKRWEDFNNFLEDMGKRPSSKHSIDRIDNNKGYTPSNCRWATIKQQNENRGTKHRCFKGHKWTKENTIPVKNKTGLTKRCKICYLARIKGVKS